MKIKIVLLLSVVAFWACGQQKSGFIINGELTDFKDKGYFLVTKMLPNDNTPFDTVWINDGKFRYEGNADSPVLTYFILEKEDSKGEFIGGFQFFFGNEDIKIKTTQKRLRSRDDVKFDFEGSPVYTEYLEWLKKSKEVSLGDIDNYKETIEKSSFYRNSKVLPFIIYGHTSKEDTDVRRQYLSDIDSSLNSNIWIKDMRVMLDNEMKLQCGLSAPDFELKDINGNSVRLSDFRGKYVLFDFSASWCGWCTKEIPYLQKVYELARGKDFVMFTIDLDNTEDKWRSVIDKKGVPWSIYSDLKGMKDGVGKLYNITGIPQIFLIDKEGRLIKDKLRGDEMVQFVDSVLTTDKSI